MKTKINGNLKSKDNHSRKLRPISSMKLKEKLSFLQKLMYKFIKEFVLFEIVIVGAKSGKEFRRESSFMFSRRAKLTMRQFERYEVAIELLVKVILLIPQQKFKSNALGWCKGFINHN